MAEDFDTRAGAYAVIICRGQHPPFAPAGSRLPGLDPARRGTGAARRPPAAVREVRSGALTYELGGSTAQAAWVLLERVANLGATPLVQVGLKVAARTATCSQ